MGAGNDLPNVRIAVDFYDESLGGTQHAMNLEIEDQTGRKKKTEITSDELLRATQKMIDQSKNVWERAEYQYMYDLIFQTRNLPKV